MFGQSRAKFVGSNNIQGGFLQSMAFKAQPKLQTKNMSHFEFWHSGTSPFFPLMFYAVILYVSIFPINVLCCDFVCLRLVLQVHSTQRLTSYHLWSHGGNNSSRIYVVPNHWGYGWGGLETDLTFGKMHRVITFRISNNGPSISVFVSELCPQIKATMFPLNISVLC